MQKAQYNLIISGLILIIMGLVLEIHLLNIEEPPIEHKGRYYAVLTK